MLHAPKKIDSLSLEQLLDLADNALNDKAYEKAVSYLTTIVEMKKANSATTAQELADAYFDLGKAHYLSAKLNLTSADAKSNLSSALKYINLSLKTYLKIHKKDIKVCKKIAAKISRLIKKLNQAKKTEEVEVTEDSTSKKQQQSSSRVKYRQALIDGELIQSVKVNAETITLEFYPKWNNSKYTRGINKMFIEIRRERPLFREQFKCLNAKHGYILTILKPLESVNPDDILTFIKRQAQRDLSSNFLAKLRKGQLISHVEVKGTSAIFHIVAKHQSKEVLHKINTALYNNYINNPIFQEYFDKPVKDHNMPKMELKEPLIGKCPEDILQKLLTVLAKTTNISKKHAKSVTMDISSDTEVLIQEDTPASVRMEHSENSKSISADSLSDYFTDSANDLSDFSFINSASSLPLSSALTFGFEGSEFPSYLSTSELPYAFDEMNISLLLQSPPKL